MIIGLTGLKGSGKDTVAAYLIKEYGYERQAFADKLKRSAAALFDINPAEFEALKNDPTAFVSIGFKGAPEGLASAMWSPSREISVREYLQRYGTEAHRDIFGADFWVDQLLPVGGYYADRNIVITDTRFISESDRIKFLSGVVVRVYRGTASADDLHASEQEQLEIEADYEIDNTGTLDELPKKVDEMLVYLGRFAR